MKNEKKNHAQMNSNQIPDLPEVPSISNIDTMELEDMANAFPFSDTTGTEPEAVLDVPSFSGLDTLDMDTAARMIEDLEDPSRKEMIPEKPVFSSARQPEAEILSEIPSFSDDTDFKETQTGLASDIPEFPVSSANVENLAIPSFLDDSEPDKAEPENLPEISAFFNFDNSRANLSAVDVPERPEEEFQGDLSEAAKDILPLIPSVLDLSELDLLSMPVSAGDNAPLLDENADYLPEIPSVTDWEEQERQESASRLPEFDEATEALLTPMTEEMLAEEEIVYVEEMPLSVKAKNGLLRGHIRSSRQLILTEESALRAIPYMDERTLQEILRYQKEKANPVYPAVKPVPKEIITYLEEFMEELSDLNIEQSRQRALKLYLCSCLPEKNRTKENCWNVWYREKHVRTLMDKYITGLIRNRQMSGLSEMMLREDIPASMDRKILTEILQDMKDNDRIHEVRGEYYILKYPPVLEFLAENTEEKEQHINVLNLRMQGSTLAEISKKTGYSKDHVFRIQNKLLRLVQKLCLINSTSVYEERFRPLFERYNLSNEIFTALTKEPFEVYQYLSMISIPGRAKPEEMKYDFGVPDWVRAAWKAYQEQKES